MAYELVDAVQLNNDLLDIADAIRAKSQGQDPLLFPSEFISEIGSIPTGASITGQTDVTVKALETITQGDTLFIYRPFEASFTDRLAGDCHKLAWSPDGTRLAVTHGQSPYITIYDTTTTPYTKLANPGTLPAGGAWGCSWSPDGTRLAVACGTSPYIYIYDTTTTPYTKLANPGTLPAGSGRGCSWSPDGTRLAVAHSTSPRITIYDTTTTPYTKLTNPGTLPTGNANDCSWSPDGKQLVVAHGTSPYFTVYNTETTPFTKLSDPALLPTGTANSCKWSADGSKLAVGFGITGEFNLYDTTTSPYTRLSTESMAATVEQMDFYDNAGTKIALSIYGNPYFCYFDMSANTVTTAKFGPFYNAYGCQFSPDKKRIAVSTTSAAATFVNVFVYEFAETTAAKASNKASYSMGGSYGYAKSSILSGYTGDAAVLFEP